MLDDNLVEIVGNVESIEICERLCSENSACNIFTYLGEENHFRYKFRFQNSLDRNNTSKKDIAPWCSKWVDWMDWMEISVCIEHLTNSGTYDGHITFAYITIAEHIAILRHTCFLFSSCEV